MLRHMTAFVLAMVAGTASLRAQLVETTRPSTGKRQPAASASKATPAKALDRKLSDFGITPRSLATWKTTGGKPNLVFYDVSFRKIEKPAPGSWERAVDPKALVVDGMTLNGFQVQGADFLANGKEYRTLALLRLAKGAPQASKDGGRTWTDGEKVGEAWVFAFDNETVTVNNADDSFQPVEFKAWALERASVTRTEKRYDQKVVPYFHSAIVTVAYGRNEMQGLMKFPGTTFVVAFRGIRFKDRWVARSLDTQPMNAYLSNYIAGGSFYRGCQQLKTDERVYQQIEITGDRLQVGTGPYINYGQEGDSAEQLRTAMEWELGRGESLADLANAYKANLNRSLWTRSDEDGSFSRTAEQAYVRTGKAVWFYPPFRSDNPAYSGRDADACLKPMVERIKGLGGKVDLIPLR